jgi:hypothetical protein
MPGAPNQTRGKDVVERDTSLRVRGKLNDDFPPPLPMQQLDQKMKEVRRKHTIETIVKLQEYKRRHIDLTQRVIQVRRRKKKTCGHLLAFCLTACY